MYIIRTQCGHRALAYCKTKINDRENICTHSECTESKMGAEYDAYPVTLSLPRARRL